MKTSIRLIISIALGLILLYAGYKFGQRNDNKEQSSLIENYSFVRNISELASLEAVGTTTHKTSNLTLDGSWKDALRKTFIENTTTITVPFVAKYGVNLQDSALRIMRKDSLVEVHLPKPKLLSFELKLDRLETTNKSGWLISQNDERFAALQKKLYTQSRGQLEVNTMYLQASQHRIEQIIKEYFRTIGHTAVCIFEDDQKVQAIPKG